MSDETEKLDVKCVCGNDQFHLTERWEAYEFFSYTLGILRSIIRCSECGAEPEIPFITTLLCSQLFRPQEATSEERSCPKCQGKQFKVSAIEHVVTGPPGKSLYPDLTEFTHRLSCADPACTWHLESIARSVHHNIINTTDNSL